MSQDKWCEVTVITSSEAVEAVTGIFLELGAAGVSIEDPKDVINSNTGPHDWDYIDEKLLPEDTGDVKVKAYFPESDNLQQTIRGIKDKVERLEDFGIKKGRGEVSVKEVFEQDWANAWKQYYKPFKIGEHIIIKPVWEEYEEDKEDIIIEIDPGMAFGTGTHETTKMCIELLEKYMYPNAEVLDIGCGSGILSIVSSKLGASKVVGIDIDEVAVRSSKENIVLSKASNVEIYNGRLQDVCHGKSDIIVANIIADVIIDIAGVIGRYLNRNGVFICSGIINDRAADVQEALKKNGLSISEVKVLGEWTAVASTNRE